MAILRIKQIHNRPNIYKSCNRFYMSLSFYLSPVSIKLITTFSMMFLALTLLKSPPCTYLCNTQTANGKFNLRLCAVPYFSMGFSRLVRFSRTPAILVCNLGERNMGRVTPSVRISTRISRISKIPTKTPRT